jgi:hypothetical protein
MFSLIYKANGADYAEDIFILCHGKIMILFCCSVWARSKKSLPRLNGTQRTSQTD